MDVLAARLRRSYPAPDPPTKSKAPTYLLLKAVISAESSFATDTKAWQPTHYLLELHILHPIQQLFLHRR